MEVFLITKGVVKDEQNAANQEKQIVEEWVDHVGWWETLCIKIEYGDLTTADSR